MKNYAVIVGGGRGKRMQAEENKAFLKIAGKEILLWTLEAFASHTMIAGMVCVVGDDSETGRLQDLIKNLDLQKKVLKVMPTEGPYRQDGVWGGIKALRELSIMPEDVVLIHNGVNPFVQASEIEASIEAARECGASVVASPVKDTIKRVDSAGMVKETLTRSELWAMQTPQAIQFSLALRAFEKAYQDGFHGTDDVQLVERCGGKVKVLECSPENIKLTTPEDLLWAERILEKRGKRGGS